jgi:hypothetical protein
MEIAPHKPESLNNPQNRPEAEPMNWDAPLMSSTQLAEEFFADMEVRVGEFMADLHNLRAESQGLDDWRFALEMSYRRDLNKSLKEQEEFRSTGKYPEPRDLLERIARERRRLNTVTSPYLDTCLNHLDELGTEDTVAQFESVYRILTFDDHLATAERLIQDCAENGELILYKDDSKHKKEVYELKKSPDDLPSSDEFMIDMVRELAAKQDINVRIYRGEAEVIQYFEDEMARGNDLDVALMELKNRKIGVIDDAMYSGDQKSDIFVQARHDGMSHFSHDKSGFSDQELERILNGFSDRLRLYVAGATNIALSRFNAAVADRIYYQRYLPSVREVLKQPYLGLLAHMFWVSGVMQEANWFNVSTIHNKAEQEAKVEHALEKPVIVTPFKVPDWMSMAQFWYMSPGQQHMLFGLKEAASAYIRAEKLLQE